MEKSSFLASSNTSTPIERNRKNSSPKKLSISLHHRDLVAENSTPGLAAYDPQTLWYVRENPTHIANTQWYESIIYGVFFGALSLIDIFYHGGPSNTLLHLMTMSNYVTTLRMAIWVWAGIASMFFFHHRSNGASIMESILDSPGQALEFILSPTRTVLISLEYMVSQAFKRVEETRSMSDSSLKMSYWRARLITLPYLAVSSYLTMALSIPLTILNHLSLSHLSPLVIFSTIAAPVFYLAMYLNPIQRLTITSTFTINNLIVLLMPLRTYQVSLDSKQRDDIAFIAGLEKSPAWLSESNDSNLPKIRR